MRTWTFLLLALSLPLPAGCTFDLGLAGDDTPGEEGRSRWSLRDGLCPGLAGACSLDVPLAAGASTRVRVEVPSLPVEELSVRADGPASVTGTSRDPEGRSLTVDLSTSGAGEVVLRLLDAGGSELDRARLQTREASGLECGTVPPGVAASYTGEGLVDERAHTLRLPRAEGEEAERVELACRVTDAGGAPLLSVDLVSWVVAAGSDHVTVRSEPLGAGSSARGARVWVEPLAAGAARVEASLGDRSEAFTFTVE